MKQRKLLSALLAAVLLLTVFPIGASAMDARSTLSEKDRGVYDSLKTQIEAVASGEASTTVFTVECPGFQALWTLEELGAGETAEGASILMDRMDKHCVDDPDAVLLALLTDLPYDFYWFDKTYFNEETQESAVAYTIPDGVAGMTDGSGTTYLFPGSYDPDSGEETATLTYEFSLRVSKDYGTLYEVDPAEAARAQILPNAQEIVGKYAGASDYEKLVGYSAAICELTDYNDDAAAGDVSFGDPWQPVCVFDGDPGTKVVCEGYSKAFKVLCDLTDFESSRIECRLVTGMLSGGTGAGPHMWNVVTMENGKNYLVDVTNCDSHDDPARFLLRGGEPDEPGVYTFDGLTFVYDAETEALWPETARTLAAQDYDPSAAVKTYRLTAAVPGGGGTVTCSPESESADGYYPAGTEITVTAAPKDENFEFVEWQDGAGKTVGTQNPYMLTLNEDTVLNAVFLDNTPPAHEHTPGEPVKENVKPATCTKDGSHDEVVICTECGEEISRTTVTDYALGHEWDAPTYEWSEDNRSATATRVCKHDASHRDSEEVKTTAKVKIKATCTEMGTTTYTAAFTNKAFTAQTKDVQDIPVKDHTPGEAVKKNEVPATCTEAGHYDTVTCCTACGKELMWLVTEVPATGHLWDDGVETAAPTTTAPGVMTYTCTVCGETRTEEIPQLTVKTGDVNADGDVNATDRMILARYLAGWEGYEEKILSMDAADIDKDGDITAKDRMILARYLAGWEGYAKYFETETVNR